MDFLELSQRVLIWVIPLVFAVTLHEVSHGWVASLCGDKTAKMLGRLTVNPLKHIDPIGTIAVPMLMLFLGGVVFGWAKPVPVNDRNFKHPKRDMALVALAGPVSNILMAIFWALIAKLSAMLVVQYDWEAGSNLAEMGMLGLQVNLLLAVLNMLPLPPLDGSRVVASYLPTRAEYWYSRLEPYGFFILMAMLLLGWLGQIIITPVVMLEHSIGEWLSLWSSLQGMYSVLGVAS